MNARFDENMNRSRHVPQAQESERATAEPEVDTSHPSGDLGNRSAEPLAYVVYALQQSVSAMANQMQEFRDSTLIQQKSRGRASTDTDGHDASIPRCSCNDVQPEYRDGEH